MPTRDILRTPIDTVPPRFAPNQSPVVVLTALASGSSHSIALISLSDPSYGNDRDEMPLSLTYEGSDKLIKAIEWQRQRHLVPVVAASRRRTEGESSRLRVLEGDAERTDLDLRAGLGLH